MPPAISVAPGPRRSALAATLVVVSVAAGCGGQPATSSTTRGSTTAAHTTDADAAQTLREQSRIVIPLDAGSPRLLTLTDSGAAFAANTGRAEESVYWVDLHDSSVRRIARVAGQVADLAANGEWLAWVEQSRIQSTEALEPVHWRIRAQELRTGTVTTVAKSRHTTRLSPSVFVDGRALYYTRYRGLARGTSDLLTIDLESGSRRTVVRDVASGQFAPHGHDLIAAVTTDRGSSPGEGKSDLFNLAASPPERITTSGKADGFQMVGDTILWEECDLKNSCSVFTLNWPGDTPYREVVAESPLATLGDGFYAVVSLTGAYDGPAVSPVGEGDDLLQLGNPPGEEMAALPATAGKLVAWTTYRGEDSDRAASLVVVRLAVD